MSEDTDAILRLVRTVRGDGRVSIRRIGSFVNDVFLVNVGAEKFVAKRYTNWVSLKWVTLSLYGLGSVFFSISGRRRMKAEHSFNELLSTHGLRVPRVLGADFKARVILFSYVLGDELSSLLRRIAGLSQAGQREKGAAYSAGLTIARAHDLDVSLGDTKPENFIVDRKGEVTLLDLEQARHNGDFSWDVAEFLFYSGHYWLSYSRALSGFLDSFLEGYQDRGSTAVLRAAVSSRYLRVFSLWTPPNVLYNIRRRLLKL